MELELIGFVYGLEVMGKGIIDFSLNNLVVLFFGVGKIWGKSYVFILWDVCYIFKRSF